MTIGFAVGVAGSGVDDVFVSVDEVSVDEVSVDGTSSLDGGDVIEATLSEGDLPALKVKLDAKTGDILRVDYEALWAGPGAMPTEEVLKDYQSVFGLRLPHTIERTTQASGTLRVDNVEYTQVSEIEGLFPTEPPER